MDKKACWIERWWIKESSLQYQSIGIVHIRTSSHNCICRFCHCSMLLPLDSFLEDRAVLLPAPLDPPNTPLVSAITGTIASEGTLSLANKRTSINSRFLSSSVVISSTSLSYEDLCAVSYRCNREAATSLPVLQYML